MSYIKNRLAIKPVIILIILSVVLITGFINFKLERIHQRNIVETLIRCIQLSNLHRIDQQMRKNYHILQALLLAKTWKDKFAMYKDKQVAKYLGASNPNMKLLLKAQQISERHGIEIDSQFLLAAYFYKENKKDIVMGLIDFDCAGIRVIK